MSRRFMIPLVLLIGLFSVFFIGLIAQQPLLTVSYLCLAPWIGIWVGRASVGIFQRTRVAVLSAQEAERLRTMRQRT
jgi:hypothetical protein